MLIATMQLFSAVSTFQPGQSHHLNVSMFERLILNGIKFARLDEQHRMRPEISRIVTEAFYPGNYDACGHGNRNVKTSSCPHSAKKSKVFSYISIPYRKTSFYDKWESNAVVMQLFLNKQDRYWLPGLLQLYIDI